MMRNFLLLHTILLVQKILKVDKKGKEKKRAEGDE